jgi:release factor glutamine methyltransferase
MSASFSLQQTPQRAWTVLSLLQWSTEYLGARGIEDARLNVELLLTHVLNLDRMGLYMKYDRPLDPGELQQFKTILQRRRHREPLQYILGETEFMGLTLKVNPHVLIPRPETELLVEKGILLLRERGAANARILDIGTGSGNIAVALGKTLPEASILSVDVSEDALTVARENILRHGIANVTVLQTDVLHDNIPGGFDMIVSNPPYVSLDEFTGLQPEVRDFEPRVATTDEADGYTFIRRICQVASETLQPQGILLMEIACNQEAGTRAIADAAGLEVEDFIRDYAGIPRILVATRP